MPVTDPLSAPLAISLFGPFCVHVHGVPVPRLRWRKQDAILVLLTLRHDRPVERTWLAGLLWPENDDSQGLATLRRYLTDLRRVLGPEAGRLQSPTAATLSLDLAGAAVDLLRFDAAIACGDEASLAEAVGLYRGPLLEGWTEEWVFEERQVREQAFLSALDRLAAAALTRQEPAAAEGYLRRAVAADPLRESAQRALMKGLAAGGSYAAALAVYRELRERLHRELNASPDGETQALFRQIREEAQARARGRGGDGATGRPDKDRGGGVGTDLLTPPLTPPPRREAFPGGNLPAPLTTLIGRQRELETLGALLRRESVRLLTLTGPGGSGKTRLALQAAAEIRDDFPEGAFFVDLAPISDPELVTPSIAQALDVREAGGQPLLRILQRFLRDRQLLLLLDNFEQVLTAAPVVAELLVAGPRVKALVTSRAPLHLQGEHSFPVPPLAVPDPQHLPPVAALAQSPAVQLFVQRASAVCPDFALTPETAPAVAAICHRLDGLPLAIELAAARSRFLPPTALLSRLECRLNLLTGGARDLPARQQTLRNAIAWSYDLLEEGTKTVFRRLAVFVGGCTLEAIEAVCNADRDLPVDVLEGVASLVEMSLLEQSGPWEGEPRWGMLETIREFARERLMESGEAAALRRGHTHYYAALVEAHVSGHFRSITDLYMHGPAEPLEAEDDNIRAALDWIVETQDAALGLRLAPQLFACWPWERYGTELRRRLAAILALPGALVPTAARAAVLRATAGLALWQGDNAAAQSIGKECLPIHRSLGNRAAVGEAYAGRAVVHRNLGNYEQARFHYEQALRIAEEREDRRSLACALYGLGYVAYLQGEYDGARTLLEQGLARLDREAGEEYDIGWVLVHLGEVADARGEYEAAYSLFLESLSIWRKRDNRFAIAETLHRMGCAARHQGDLKKARACFTESLTVFQEDENPRFNAECLEGLAGVACQQGQNERAARLLGAAAAAREAISVVPRPIDRADLERLLSAARATLGEEAFAAAWAEGRGMALEDAIAYALEY